MKKELLLLQVNVLLRCVLRRTLSGEAHTKRRFKIKLCERIVAPEFIEQAGSLDGVIRPRD